MFQPILTDSNSCPVSPVGPHAPAQWAVPIMESTPALAPREGLEARLLALASDLLGIVDAEGRLQPASANWSRHEGVVWVELLHAEDRTAAQAALRTGAEGLVARLGDQPVSWTVSPEPDGSALVAGRDISDLRRMADELQEFAYAASHDLAEPLRMVTSYLELLQRRYAGQLDETADEFIYYAVGGAQRMKELIDALLAYSRAGSHEMAVESVDLHALVADRATVEGALPAVRGDAVLLGRLFDQLFDNARKFGGSRVGVAATQRAGGCRVEVSDDGIGIPEAQQERIFKPFSRLNGRDEYAGAGIGLAVCRRVAQRHGGRIEVRSEPGKGSVFSVWLPA